MPYVVRPLRGALWTALLCSMAANAQPPAREGFVDVPGGKVWYRIVGSGPATPLLVLHGGPGASSDYLFSLDVLADERPVIFYDQLGSKRSDHPTDASLWRVDRFVDELEAVRKALHLDKIHLYGHSWGSMLAAEYVITRNPSGIESLTLASPVLSVSRFIEDVKQLVAALPADIRTAIGKHEAAGTTDSPEYLAALTEFYKRHLVLTDPWPDYMAVEFANPQVYGTLWGASELQVTGPLKDFERMQDLGPLTMPVLYTVGRFDECVPATVAEYQRLTPGAKLVVIEDAAHATSVDQPERNAQAVRDFLRSVESGAP